MDDQLFNQDGPWGTWKTIRVTLYVIVCICAVLGFWGLVLPYDAFCEHGHLFAGVTLAGICALVAANEKY